MAGKSLRVFVLVFGVWVVKTQANSGQVKRLRLESRYLESREVFHLFQF